MERKIINSVQIRKKDEESRTIEFVASDETRDSYGTIIPADKWNLERFNKNGVIGYQHNLYGENICNPADPDDVIGKGVARIEDKQLIIAVTFEPEKINPKAEKVYQKILFGSLKAVSVGFTPTKKGHWGKGDEAQEGVNPTYYYNGQELIELSVVNIPSNPNALKRALRDNVASALTFIYNSLEGQVKIGDIEKMTVGDIFDLLEKKNAEPKENEPIEEEKTEVTETTEEEIEQRNTDDSEILTNEILTIANSLATI